MFHEKFARLFRASWINGHEGKWPLVFAGKTFVAPLGVSTFPLDWETAVSILGHDASVKQTYELLVSGSHRPTLFVDIGANYGTHSLLFLVSGIDTLTFEPNAACHPAFLRMCSQNAVTSSWQPVALGSVNGEVTLTYPETETWLGSSTPELLASFGERRDLVRVQVEQRRLDDFLEKMRGHRVLVKIDTEGNEADVLEGAVQVMKEIRPAIIFESWKAGGRPTLHAVLGRFAYEIRRLPWDGSRVGEPLSLEQFEASDDSNFVACAHDRQ